MNKEEKWAELDTVSGSLQAELLQGLLEAQGIHVFLSQEGAGRSAYAVNVGPLGEVHIFVFEDELDQAKKILDDYYAGKYEDVTLVGEEEEDEDNNDSSAEQKSD